MAKRNPEEFKLMDSSLWTGSVWGRGKKKKITGFFHPFPKRRACSQANGFKPINRDANLWRSKIGRLSFFHYPSPGISMNSTLPPPDKLTQPPMGMTLDIIWSLTWIHTIKIRNHRFDARNNLCQWLNTSKNAPETVLWIRKIQVLS